MAGEDGFDLHFAPKGAKLRFGSVEPSPAALIRAAFNLSNPPSKYPNAQKDQSKRIGLFVVGEDGFEPSKRNAADLQSVPFGHSGTPPYSIIGLEPVDGLEPPTY